MQRRLVISNALARECNSPQIHLLYCRGINVALCPIKKRESQLQQRFGRWLQYAYKGGSAAFELKRTTGTSLPVSSIRPHQLHSLRLAKTGIYYKPPDDSRAYKPCDTLFIRGGRGYLVIGFGPILRGFYLIGIEKLDEWIEQGITHINEFMAQEFGEYVEFPKN